MPSSSGSATCLPRVLLVRSSIVQLRGIADRAAESSKVLHDQLEALAALASRVAWDDKSKTDGSSWESIIVDAFSRGGSDEEVQRAGQMGVKGALEEVR